MTLAGVQPGLARAERGIWAARQKVGFSVSVFGLIFSDLCNRLLRGLGLGLSLILPGGGSRQGQGDMAFKFWFMVLPMMDPFRESPSSAAMHACTICIGNRGLPDRAMRRGMQARQAATEP